MSGSIFSSGFALAGLLIGGGGEVTLGAFTADWLETPEKMPFGGEQRMVEHKLLGGAKVFDLLGPEEEDISFSGIFFGPLAQIRAQMLDTMRLQGQVVPLIWPGDSRSVIIKKFHCDYASGGGVMPYSVTCVVVPNIPIASQQGAQPSQTTQANADASTATTTGATVQTARSSAVSSPPASLGAGVPPGGPGN